MGKIRVLLLHSFKDGGYAARLQQIANNPSLDGIAFRHCCVIDRDRHSSRIAELDRWQTNVEIPRMCETRSLRKS